MYLGMCVGMHACMYVGMSVGMFVCMYEAPGSGEHKGKAQPKDFVCCVCGRACKSLAGFKSHCRSHDRQ